MGVRMDLVVLKRNDITVRIDAAVASEAKKVAALRNQSLAEYLSEVLAPVVHSHLLMEAEKWLSEEQIPKRHGKPKDDRSSLP